MQLNFEDKLTKHVLSNGLTLLIYPLKTIPRVSIQLWYNVGSKHEDKGQKGLAHFLEHMLFKGTKKMSEVDMIQITDKLSGHCNAFTSQDYTAYIFDFPKMHWNIGITMLADTMRNCTFKQELLDSELAAVIQEIKLYNDDYESCLEQEMLATIFDDHPYHYPVIGFRQDLLNMSRQTMLDFYHKHYIPNNATLIVVGDIEIDQVIKNVDDAFGLITPDFTYKKPTFHCKKDLMTKSVTLYRDVQQPLACVAFIVPGLATKKSYILDAMAWILANGKGSRLYKKLVNDLSLVTHIEGYTELLTEYGIFFIVFNPKNIQDCPIIQELISKEIESIIENGLNTRELTRAIKQIQTDYIEYFEDYDALSIELGRLFSATGDATYALTYLDVTRDSVESEIQSLLTNHYKPILMHTGLVTQLPHNEKKYWLSLQESSDKQTEDALSKRTRKTPLEAGSYVNTINIEKPLSIYFPKPVMLMLENGCKVLYHNNIQLPTIDLILEFKIKHDISEQKQGLYNFVMALLLEGTQQYTAGQLADEFETYGMSVRCMPGFIHISMLSDDLAHGLSLLKEILCQPLFEQKAIERVREQILTEINDYWDDAYTCIDQLARKAVFQQHPHAYNLLGTVDSISSITRDDITNFFDAYISPQGATIAIVGNLNKIEILPLLGDTVALWKGPIVPDSIFPSIQSGTQNSVRYAMNRDQLALAFAGISLARTDPNFDKLMIFDQIFTGGPEGSMNSKLFKLREQSGLFYTIRASLFAGADDQPGMAIIKTLISLDRTQEVIDRIKKTIDSAVLHLNTSEVEQAINNIINNLTSLLASNKQIAEYLLFLERYAFPQNYFENRSAVLSSFTISDIKQTASTLLCDNEFFLIQVGRVNKLTL